MAKTPKRGFKVVPGGVSVLPKAPNAKAKRPQGNVEFIRKEIADMQPQYDLVRDCIEGEITVKAAGDKYLPRPNPTNVSQANKDRYEDYKTRAVFYNVTKRTRAGLLGQVFLRDPVIEVPALLDPVIKDADGAGVTIEQFAEKVEEYVISYGRAGILTDYPKVEGTTSRAEQLSGSVRPTLTCYLPWNIINWRTMSRGGRTILSLVVLRETYQSNDDEFEIEFETQYRVLRLIDNIYNVEIWRKSAESANAYNVYEARRVPLDSTGKPLDEIPFMFVGAKNNDPDVDPSPLYDLAALNIAHYRNSADYEESVYMVGQPQPVFTGLTEHWVTNVLKGVVQLGSQAAIPLPEGATAQMLQAAPNSLVKEAMESKERQMVALGAKLVEQKTVQRTATEATQEEASEVSTLTTITRNVSKAVKWSLEWAGIFAGAFTARTDAMKEVIKFELNTEFDLATATPEELKTAVEFWLKEAITYSEMRGNLRKAGIATLDDKAARTEMISDRDSLDFSKDEPEPEPEPAPRAA